MYFTRCCRTQPYRPPGAWHSAGVASRRTAGSPARNVLVRLNQMESRCCAGSVCEESFCHSCFSFCLSSCHHNALALSLSPSPWLRCRESLRSAYNDLLLISTCFVGLEVVRKCPKHSRSHQNHFHNTRAEVRSITAVTKGQN